MKDYAHALSRNFYELPGFKSRSDLYSEILEATKMIRAISGENLTHDASLKLRGTLIRIINLVSDWLEGGGAAPHLRTCLGGLRQQAMGLMTELTLK